MNTHLNVTSINDIHNTGVSECEMSNEHAYVCVREERGRSMKIREKKQTQLCVEPFFSLSFFSFFFTAHVFIKSLECFIMTWKHRLSLSLCPTQFSHWQHYGLCVSIIISLWTVDMLTWDLGGNNQTLCDW